MSEEFFSLLLIQTSSIGRQIINIRGILLSIYNQYMKERRNLSYHSISYSLLLVLVLLLLGTHIINSSLHFPIPGDVYGHLADLLGVQSDVISKSIGNYVILFQTSPSPVLVNNNMTLLRFSITQNDQDTIGIFAALLIKEKSSGTISAQYPYKFYEFGDINFRHTFLNTGDHEVILQARTSDDPQYQNNPLVANFDVPVTNEGGIILDTSAQIIVILVIAALPVGMIILILDFNKRARRRSSTTN